MRSQRTVGLLRASVGCVVLLTALILFLGVTLARSAPPTASRAPDLVGKQNDLAYDQPIIFFEEGTQILVFYSNGDIIHRGRKVTNDRAVVRALQEILSLSPCKREGGPAPAGTGH